MRFRTQLHGINVNVTVTVFKLIAAYGADQVICNVIALLNLSYISYITDCVDEMI